MERDIRLALKKVQEKVGSIKKTAKNTYHKSTYIPLVELYNAYKKELLKENILIFHDIVSLEGQLFSKTTLQHIEKDASYSTLFPLILEKQTPQGVASANTYAKRQAICNLFAIAGDEDDDGNAAEGLTKSAKKVAPVKAPKDANVEYVGDDHLNVFNTVVKRFDDAQARIKKAMALYQIDDLRQLPVPRFNEFLATVKRGV